MASLTQAAPPKSDQLNADDLIGGPRTIKVREVRVHGDGEQRVSVYFEGDNGKPFKPCKSMIRVMAQVWGDESENAVGQSMTLFCDPKVKFGGTAVGGIRISHMTGLKAEKSFGLTATRGRRAQYTVKPLNVEASRPPQSEADPNKVRANGLITSLRKLDSVERVSAWEVNERVTNAIDSLPYELRDEVTAAIQSHKDILAGRAEYDAPPEEDDSLPADRPFPGDT